MKRLPLPARFLPFAVFAAFAVSQLPAQNIVNDPGFEDSTDTIFGNPFSSAWTLTEPGGFSEVGGNPAFSRSRNNYAALGPAVGQTGSLLQVLSTTPGSFYDLSLWLANDVASGVTAFEIFWNGTSVLSLSSLPVQGYTNYAVNSLVATGSATTLEFRYRHDADFFRLDDVSVVPEPSVGALAVLGVGLLGFAKYYRMKRHRRVA